MEPLSEIANHSTAVIKQPIPLAGDHPCQSRGVCMVPKWRQGGDHQHSFALHCTNHGICGCRIQALCHSTRVYRAEERLATACQHSPEEGKGKLAACPISFYSFEYRLYSSAASVTCNLWFPLRQHSICSIPEAESWPERAVQERRSFYYYLCFRGVEGRPANCMSRSGENSERNNWILCSTQDAGLASQIEFPPMGPPYFKGSVIISDSASVRSGSKQPCP